MASLCFWELATIANQLSILLAGWYQFELVQFGLTQFEQTNRAMTEQFEEPHNHLEGYLPSRKSVLTKKAQIQCRLF